MNPSQRFRRDLVAQGRSVLANFHTDHDLITWAIASGLAVNIGRSYNRRYGLPQCGWGNRFLLRGKSEAAREAVCAAHERWLAGRPELLERLPELRGKVLCCYCHPLRCHGEALIARLSRL